MSSATFFSYDHGRETLDYKLASSEWYDSEYVLYPAVVSTSSIIAPDYVLRYEAHGSSNYALYTTCAATHNDWQWQNGYEELVTLLRKRAKQVYPDIWEDAVQSACEHIYRNVDRCRDPHAFFQFAWGYVQNAARSIRLQNGGHSLHMVSLEQRTAAGQDSLAEQLADPSVAIETTILKDELQQEIRSRFALIEQRYPQAHRQFAAIKLKYFEGLDDDAISNRLAAPVKSVYELRARGLQKLRRDPVLSQLFDQYQGKSAA
jgi:RNA polymerase sigma factor (sigma-70 family)